MIIAYPLGSDFTNINPFILYYEFSLCCEKVSDYKEFSRGNSKFCCKSQSQPISRTLRINIYRQKKTSKQTNKKQAILFESKNKKTLKLKS